MEEYLVRPTKKVQHMRVWWSYKDWPEEYTICSSLRNYCSVDFFAKIHRSNDCFYSGLNECENGHTMAHFIKCFKNNLQIHRTSKAPHDPTKQYMNNVESVTMKLCSEYDISRRTFKFSDDESPQPHPSAPSSGPSHPENAGKKSSYEGVKKKPSSSPLIFIRTEGGYLMNLKMVLYYYGHRIEAAVNLNSDRIVIRHRDTILMEILTEDIEKSGFKLCKTTRSKFLIYNENIHTVAEFCRLTPVEKLSKNKSRSRFECDEEHFDTALMTLLMAAYVRASKKATFHRRRPCYIFLLICLIILIVIIVLPIALSV